MTPDLKSAADTDLAHEVSRLSAELADARRQIEALERLADIDPLTEILNRRGFERELARTLAHVERYGAAAVLVYLDLDGFKAVNDRHGHAAGDAVLREVAGILLRQVRMSDVVGRLGGDEFAVLLWHLVPGQAEAKARALEAEIAAAAFAAAPGCRIGVSAGVSGLLAGQSMADLLAAADRAMYARKRNPSRGRDRPVRR